jgi:hypothetical protein
MKKFRTGVVLICAAVCVLLTTGCAFKEMASVVINTNKRLKEEDLLKRLNLPPDILAQIDSRHQVVGKDTQLDSLVVSCRIRDGLLTDPTRIIYLDSSVKHTVLKHNPEDKFIFVELQKGDSKATLKMDNKPYDWKTYQLKATEIATVSSKQ